MCYAIDVAKFWKASVAFPVGEVLPLLRRSAQERGFHGIRAAPGAGQLPGDRRPAAPGVGAEIGRARLQSKNLWIDDGSSRVWRVHSFFASQTLHNRKFSKKRSGDLF